MREQRTGNREKGPRIPRPPSRIPPSERYGRILLAFAVGLLFLTVFGSMVTGRVLLVGFIIAGVAGVLGAAGMLAARYRSG